MNYLAKSDAISTLQGRDLDDKVMDCLGGVSARFPSKDLIVLRMREGLYLCEHDSTVWVHFCPFDFEMLWRNFSLISCIIIWFRGGRGAERVFFPIMSCLVFSVIVGIMLDM